MEAKKINGLQLEEYMDNLEQIESLLFFIRDSITEGPNALERKTIGDALYNIENQLSSTIDNISNVIGVNRRKSHD